jgi:putative endonuclease
MKPVNKTQIGRWGEELAEKYLLAKGYEITFRNWRTGRLEIDLVARKGDLLVFVEVKTRANHDFGFPEEFVTPEKARRIKKAATDYQYQHPDFRFIRFDIVAITGTEIRHEIEHLEDAF